VRTFAPHTPPHPQIKVILLDQTSLDWGKNVNGWPWPWPRTVYSAVIDFCRRGGAKAVAFDVLYTEPSNNGVADDLALGEALRRSSNFVGACFLSEQSGEATNWPAGYRPLAFPLQNLDTWLARHRAALQALDEGALSVAERIDRGIELREITAGNDSGHHGRGVARPTRLRLSNRSAP